MSPSDTPTQHFCIGGCLNKVGHTQETDMLHQTHNEPHVNDIENQERYLVNMYTC